MRILALIISLIWLPPFHMMAQSQWYAATQINLNEDLYNVSDEGIFLEPPKNRILDDPGFSFILGYQLSDMFSLESGINSKDFKTGFSFNYESGLMTSYSIRSLNELPLRTRARINILGEWLYVTGHVGFILGLPGVQKNGLIYTGRGSGITNINSTETLEWNTRSEYKEKYYSMMEAGTGFEFQIFKRFQIYTTISYTRGFSQIEQFNVKYQIANGREYNGSIISEGTYLSFNQGIRYHFK